jgi:hypothetical protein
MAIAGDLAARNGEPREALVYLAGAVQIMHWQGQLFGVGTLLVRVATVLVDRDPEAAMIVDGAGEALAPGFVHSPDTAAARAQAVANATAALGDARRAELHAQGLQMSGDKAVASVTEAVNRYLAETESEE